MANIYSGILSSMVDAYASVISNNMNSIMKFLTTVDHCPYDPHHDF